MNINRIWLTEKEYQFIVGKIPIHCVDLVILRKNKGNLETMLLIRKTGYEKGKYCILGGRQWKNETSKETIKRLAKELGVEISIFPPFTYDFPAWVNSRLNQDLTKQCVCSIYPVLVVKGTISKEGEEYSGYQWFPVKKLPNSMAYDHKFEVEIVVKQLEKFSVK